MHLAHQALFYLGQSLFDRFNRSFLPINPEIPHIINYFFDLFCRIILIIKIDYISTILLYSSDGRNNNPILIFFKMY